MMALYAAFAVILAFYVPYLLWQWWAGEMEERR